MMLVVIGMLAFLMVTASGAPRGLVRRSMCMKNLKEISLAIRIYAQDNGGKFPADSEQTTLGSFALLPANSPRYPAAPTHKTLYAALVCPNDEMAIFHRVVPGSPHKLITAKNLSYAYAGFGLTESAQSDTAIACDRSSTGKWNSSRPWNRNRWTHESEGGNILFADGHVAFTQSSAAGLDRMKNP
jgi:prepilin-type processing-associated H-X9-DG protein